MSLRHENTRIWALSFGCFALLVMGMVLYPQKRVIERAEFGNYSALWRITHDPAVDEHANYHMQSCWSPDGRYLVYTHRELVALASSPRPYTGRDRPLVRLYDLFEDKDLVLGRGIMQGFGPCWANRHNWLFWVQSAERNGGPPAPQDDLVLWLNADTGAITRLGAGFDQIGGVDCHDEWVYGGIRDTTRKPPFRAARVRIGPQGGVEELPGVTGFQWVPNPAHPVLHTRDDHLEEPFGANRWFWDLDGTHRRSGQWGLETCHAAWQGDGEHLLLGDGLARGRRWNAMAEAQLAAPNGRDLLLTPGDVHVLAAGTAGNLSACGRSGRFLVGDTHLFDTRSGDSWRYKFWVGMTILPSRSFYPIFDGEAKGSPDATKVAFTDHYDMEKGPVTLLSRQHGDRDGTLHVVSTEGFPPSGALVLRFEVIGYERKTVTTFEGLTRGLHGTCISAALAGDPVTDFEHHLLNDEQWSAVKAVGADLRMSVKDLGSPLLRQRRNSIWVMAVRPPDAPVLITQDGEVLLVPGESHFETCGYHLLLNGHRVTKALAHPGNGLPLTAPGSYQAVAVEWSGLSSPPGPEHQVEKPMALRVLTVAPTGFSWTSKRWRVEGNEVSADVARKALEAEVEILHIHDGVMAREWYRSGILSRRHDLNPEGKAIRRLTYEAGRLAVRDYFNRDGEQVSSERLDPAGFITEQLRMSKQGGTPTVADHWWYERGIPVRRVTGRSEFVKEGERWAQK